MTSLVTEYMFVQSVFFFEYDQNLFLVPSLLQDIHDDDEFTV
jgi:hypothetical protein